MALDDRNKQLAHLNPSQLYILDGSNALIPATQAMLGGGAGLTDTQLRATPVPVSGPLTDTQLRATSVPVSGPLTDTQLRATSVPVEPSLVGRTVATLAATSDYFTTSTSSAQSAAITGTVIRVALSAASYIKFGANPTAAAADDSHYMPAGVEYFRFTSGEKVAVINLTGTGVATITAVS